MDQQETTLIIELTLITLLVIGSCYVCYKSRYFHTISEEEYQNLV
jgi:hypothetical protein